MRHRSTPLIVILSAAAIAAGCHQRVDLGGYRTVADIPPESFRKLDMLFVVDDSNSMRQEQEALATRAESALFDVLGGAAGRRLDLHVGVVSTDLGGPSGYCGDGRGGQLTVNACPGIDGSYLVDASDGSGGRDRNFDGTLAGNFACMAQIGDQGCGFEQPLEAMKRALDGSNPENAGFVREGALLVVAFVTDEDDCSAKNPDLFSGSAGDPVDSELGPLSSFRCFEYGVTCAEAPREPGLKSGCVPDESSPYLHPVSRYVEFLRELKGERGRTVVTGVFGPADRVAVDLEDLDGDGNGDLEPKVQESCESERGLAYPAVRLGAVVDAFPARGLATSICSDDFASPMTRMSDFIGGVSSGRPCLHGAIADRDEDADGVQPSCRVRLVTDDHERRDAASEADIPACPADGPCYELRRAPSMCAATASKLALELDVAEGEAAGRRTIVECRFPAP